MNKLIKFLSSIPLILIMLYFIPFLGICLILLRYFVSDTKKRTTTPIIIAVVGLLILIPKGVELILDILKIDVNSIPYFGDIVTSKIYQKDLLDFSKYLITVGIIFLIISYVTKSVFDKVSNKLSGAFKGYVNETAKQQAEISRQNDLKIKEKQAAARTTSYVKCPKCGSDNIISDKFSRCKYCRSALENKNYK